VWILKERVMAQQLFSETGKSEKKHQSGDIQTGYFLV
jgi:hypothetical protein